MLNKSLMAAAVAAGMVFAANASAQVYAGASIGQARWNADCTGVSNCKNNDTAFKFDLGYNFSKNLAVEASYFDLGKMSASAYTTVGNVAANAKADGFDVAVVGSTDLSNEWTLFGKLGIANVHGTIEGSGLGVSVSQSRNSTVPVLGFGVKYNATKNIAIRGDIDTRKVKIPYTEGNVTNFNIGVEFSF